MGKIDSFNITHLNNSEHTGFHTSVHGFMTQAGLENIGAVELDPPYKSAIDIMQDLVHRSTRSPYTPEKDVLDSDRDDGTEYVIDRIYAALKSPIAAEREAATALVPIVSPYKGIASRPKGQESVDIKGMILDLRAPGVAAHVTTLTLDAAIDALEVLNNRYVEIDKLVVVEKPAYAETQEKRKAIDDLYRQIADRAYATALLTPNDKVAEFIRNVNNLIRQTSAAYNQRVAQLKVDRKKKETDGK
ncbi:DUF6261 family protein [Limibacterium fermenti]|uniref:DUF6261 family protein n=1 Tax=Limibacterium fermenti TaxID=3229863 RepID=UPI000E8F93D0|nr:hypothetical protein [Porphyromonadaceae bacterium]